MSSSVGRYVAMLPAVLIAAVLPLVFDKGGYSTIEYTKGAFVRWMLLLESVAFVPFLIYQTLRGKFKSLLERMETVDWAVLAFLLSAVISTFMSPNPLMSFKGFGMQCGTAVLLCGGISYFWISRHSDVPRRLLYVIVVAWIFLYLWSFANAFGVNFFGLAAGDETFRPFTAVASLGHYNAASAFFCLTIPLIAVLYIRGGSQLESILYGAGIFAGVLASLSICVDGMWYGFILASAFVLLWALADADRHRRMWMAVLLCAAAFVVYRCLLALGLVHRAECESVFLAEHRAGEGLMMVSVLMLAILRHKPVLTVPHTLRIVLFAGILTVFATVLTYTFILGFSDPHFGTARGAVWKGGIWAYRLYSPVEKVFGLGFGGYVDKLTVATNMLLDRPGSTTAYITCHNSFLQALLAQGALGLAIFLAGIFEVFRRLVKNYGGVSFNRAFPAFIAVVAYLGQSMVTSTYPMTVMMLFLMLGLYRGGLSKKEE